MNVDSAARNPRAPLLNLKLKVEAIEPVPKPQTLKSGSWDRPSAEQVKARCEANEDESEARRLAHLAGEQSEKRSDSKLNQGSEPDLCKAGAIAAENAALTKLLGNLFEPGSRSPGCTSLYRSPHDNRVVVRLR
jgi:hypothetical protein